MRFGFGHRQENLGPGDLAILCPVCPQPGVNLPKNWEADTHQYVYLCNLDQFTYVADTCTPDSLPLMVTFQQFTRGRKTMKTMFGSQVVNHLW